AQAAEDLTRNACGKGSAIQTALIAGSAATDGHRDAAVAAAITTDVSLGRTDHQRRRLADVLRGRAGTVVAVLDTDRVRRRAQAAEDLTRNASCKGSAIQTALIAGSAATDGRSEERRVGDVTTYGSVGGTDHQGRRM